MYLWRISVNLSFLKKSYIGLWYYGYIINTFVIYCYRSTMNCFLYTIPTSSVGTCSPWQLTWVSKTDTRTPMIRGKFNSFIFIFWKFNQIIFDFIKFYLPYCESFISIYNLLIQVLKSNSRCRIIKMVKEKIIKLHNSAKDMFKNIANLKYLSVVPLTIVNWHFKRMDSRIK